MKYKTFPFDGIPDLDGFSDYLRDNKNVKDDYLKLLKDLEAVEQRLPENKRLSPDVYGAEHIFINYFVNNDMESDFPLIARDFYMHEFKNMPEYEDVENLSIDTGEDWPLRVFIRFTLSLMLNAVHAGSEYARALILYLYKTYYKQEYKSLKRFRSITSGELLALAEPDGRNTSYFGNLARILCIAKMSGIEISSDCNYIYTALNELSDRYDNRELFSLSGVSGENYKNCLQEIKANFDSKELNSLNKKMSRYLGNVLKWLGYSPDFVDLCDDNAVGITSDLAIALAILKRTFAERQYSAEELTLYAAVIHCASALTCSMDWMTETLETLAYGEAGTFYYDDFPPLFHPENLKVQKPQTKKQKIVMPAKKAKPETEKAQNQYNEDTLLAEIDTLRRKIHKLESDNTSLRAELTDRKRKEDEARAFMEQLEAANSELASLRDYVYNLTEDDSPSYTVSIDSMKEAISELRIVIIGGHSNWTSKMKREFPNWTFIKPAASGSTDASVVDKADHVYFFTDTISHSRYYQFLNVIRERKIDFGYIHGVNIEKNIRDIYRDFEKK